MLKLNRLLLKPLKPSLYGKLRREPRKDCLSTLEAAAETLEFLARDKVAADMLRTKFVAKLDEIRSKTSATNSL